MLNTNKTHEVMSTDTTSDSKGIATASSDPVKYLGGFIDNKLLSEEHVYLSQTGKIHHQPLCQIWYWSGASRTAV